MAWAGADHAGFFVGLLGGIDEHPTESFITAARNIYYGRQPIATRILAAVRSASQVLEALAADADEITAPHKIWTLFFQNEYTHARRAAYSGDWRKAHGNRNWLTGY